MQTGLQLMADYVFLSKYSQRNKDGYLETWDEVNKRIYETHKLKLDSMDVDCEDIYRYLDTANKLEDSKIILSSQRARQFAFPKLSSGILKHEARIYNCCGTYVDRMKVFSETMYLLLCGCGVGYSLHKDYVNKIPKVKKHNNETTSSWVVEDTIEGWANSIDILVNLLWSGITNISFDYSKIRGPEELIDGKFKAPGYEPLMQAHNNIINMFKRNNIENRKLTTLEFHDLMCYIAQSVVSGGVRRSALIALFDKDDQLMLNCKTGDWWDENPQRAMANNSILTTYDDPMTYQELKSSMKVIKQFGEPGFVTVPDYSYLCNPCGEIIFRPKFGKKSGFAFCNLVEINAEEVNSAEKFYEACKIASVIATVQSLYTNFKYLDPISQKIAERDRNIGVSITGIMGNPLMRDKDVLTKGASIVVDANKVAAKLLDINSSRTCTTVKPSGNASTILGLTCSGIHPAHSNQYIRRIRIKNNSSEFLKLKDTPLVKQLSDSESIISFPIDTNNISGIIYKDDITAVEHLDIIKTIKHFWINKGSINKTINHNISATVEVTEDEWDEVAAVLYTNKYLLTGVSLLPKIGDQLYTYAPFTRLYSQEIIDEYISLENYIKNNDINFNEIMSSRHEMQLDEMSAMGCTGGMCELR